MYQVLFMYGLQFGFAMALQGVTQVKPGNALQLASKWFYHPL
jgi:hypothetical protein